MATAVDARTQTPTVTISMSESTDGSFDRGVPLQTSSNGNSPRGSLNRRLSNRSSPNSRAPKSTMTPVAEADESKWGANFWVTLVEPQTQTPFYACPATGEVSWDPPIGHFVMPPSEEGEWWELRDDSRGGLPYYYHTKSNETVWEKPDAFVIPFGILQNTSLGRRLSLIDMKRMSQALDEAIAASQFSNPSNQNTSAENAKSPKKADNRMSLSKSVNGMSNSSSANHRRSSRYAVRRSISNDQYLSSNSSSRDHGYTVPHTSLPPIPASPYATDVDNSPSPSRKSLSIQSSPKDDEKDQDKTKQSPKLPTINTSTEASKTPEETTPPRSTKLKHISYSYRGAPPQSLDAMAELLASNSIDGSPTSSNDSDPIRPSSKPSPHQNFTMTVSGSGSPSPSPAKLSPSLARLKTPAYAAASASTPNLHLHNQFSSPSDSMHSDTGSGTSGLFFHASDIPSTPVSMRSMRTTIDIDRSLGVGLSGAGLGLGLGVPPPPPSPSLQRNGKNVGKKGRSNTITASKSASGRLAISTPIVNHEATRNLSPVKARIAGKPILLEPRKDAIPASLIPLHDDSDDRPMLPDDLVSDIRQFVQSDFAKQYFQTHRTGFIFKRRVPVEQLMMWQKAPLNSPLLLLNKSLQRDAVKVFKVIQRLMGDRERDKPVGVRIPAHHAEGQTATITSLHNGPAPPSASVAVILEEERWLLSEGIAHGELRDEIYCQLVKQLTGNPNIESQFRGWQLLCVLLVTFPPSKNFEAYLRAFMHNRSVQTEGRIDVMAKYCLQRLPIIARKGPRGKPPTTTEIETASDAAFNPSTFGESLDAIFRLQERTYPHLRVPLILPFLADGILALGGTKSEGIFRVPGDGDVVSELKVRIEKGYYNLEGIDDPHVLASLLKLWLRELCDPLVPDELYNDCIACANNPDACVLMVSRLPTINRRVVLFIVSFLQLFLEEKIQTVTKMPAPNLALVMTPNLLRCNSESMSIVFTNAAYEQTFVHNLLLHLKCNKVDPDYIPRHGIGAGDPVMSSPSNPRNGNRRPR